MSEIIKGTGIDEARYTALVDQPIEVTKKGREEGRKELMDKVLFTFTWMTTVSFVMGCSAIGLMALMQPGLLGVLLITVGMVALHSVIKMLAMKRVREQVQDFGLLEALFMSVVTSKSWIEVNREFENSGRDEDESEELSEVQAELPKN